MKIVIIGTNHAGIAAANTLLDNYPGHEITMIDRNSNMSYLGCGTALWVGRQIDQPNELFYARPDDFEAKGAKVLTETEVSSIDFEQKKCMPQQKPEKSTWKIMTNSFLLWVQDQSFLKLQVMN